MMKLGRLIAAGLLAGATSTFAQAPAAKPAGPPPIEAFFDEGSVQGMGLSPNGRWRAAQVVPAEGGPPRLVVSDLQDKEPPLAVAAFSRANVRDFRWVNDDLLIAFVTDERDLSVDWKGTMLVSATRDGKSMRQLIKSSYESGFQTPGIAPLEPNHWFLRLGKPGTDEIIIAEGRFDRGQSAWYENLLVMNARTGARRTMLKDAPADVVAWWFDPHGTPRLAASWRENVYVLRWRAGEAEEWREIARFETLRVPFWPAFIDGKGQLYVSVDTAEGKTEQLRKFDFAAGKPAAEPMLSTPGYDGGFRPIFDRVSGDLLGVRLRLDAAETVWLDARVAALQKQIDARIQGRVNELLCTRCDEPALLVYSYSDRAPGDYLLWRPAGGQLERLGSTRPAIDPQAMAPTHFERIKARDGADLPVWVTLPGGGSAKSKPAVVLVHGGPWSRGRIWGWNDEAQFLASRGYVVIEPEFRGSTGYGDAHYRAGFRKWGLEMQDDVSDAVEWVVKKGWVDGKRVCIAGASYGGYATLMGLAKTPDAYRCGVAWVGVSDPRLMFSIHWSDIGATSKKYTMKAMIGDPEKDAAMLAAVAPLTQAERMKAPLLLAYGAMDRRVPIEHGEQMRAALRKAGKDPEWVVYDNEGHGWWLLETQKDFWGRVERFLARNLAP
jgi:dipeptidyl aminopeptidase/acylaminoacyl peptidase